VSRSPDFDELVGPEVGGEARERLRRTHELLVAAGPPPELSPELAAGPTLAMTLGRRPGRARRRLYLLAAAAIAVAAVFLGGYVAGNRGGSGVAAVRTLELRGTAAAPGALASLRILPGSGGNWPMRLTVTGLPKLPRRAYYEVFLVRGGKEWAPCGTFLAPGGDRAVTVTLNAPYRLRPGDRWLVTRRGPGATAPGVPVLEPAA